MNLGSEFEKALKNVLRCMFLRNENNRRKIELEVIAGKKAYLKASMAANAGEVHRLASINALAVNSMNEAELKAMDAAMEIAYGDGWENLKLIAKPKCNRDGKPSGVKNCSGCDSCTCED